MEPAEYQRIYDLEATHWWYKGLHDLVLSTVGDRPGARVLDVGCGTGRLMELGATRFQVLGLDDSPLALAFCRLRGQSGVLRGSAGHLPFVSQQFDVIFCIDVLYHERVSDDDAALREFHRVLRQGGMLVLHVPALEMLHGSHDRVVHSRRRFRRREVRKMLAESGFRIGKLTYRNFFLFPLILLYRSFRSERRASDLFPIPRLLNLALSILLRLENRLARYIPLPFGSSIFAVAFKD